MASLGLKRCMFVNPEFAEWLMGFPRGWTSPVDQVKLPEGENALQTSAKRFRCASMFAGVGGLDLGARDLFDTIVYYDNDVNCQKVLQSRMKDGVLHVGGVEGDVRGLAKSPTWLRDIEAICAGFPCPDISKTGSKLGLSGDRSSLFAEVVKVAAASNCKVLLLENVAHIISRNQAAVFFEIIGWLQLIGLKFMKWGVVTAGNVGSPQTRARWFLLACRSACDVARVQALAPKLTERNLMELASGPWNAEHCVPMESWMIERLPRESKERLCQLGNAVVPQCCAVAVSLLAHMK